MSKYIYNITIETGLYEYDTSFYVYGKCFSSYELAKEFLINNGFESYTYHNSTEEYFTLPNNISSEEFDHTSIANIEKVELIK